MSKALSLMIIPILILAACGNRTVSSPLKDYTPSNTSATQIPSDTQENTQENTRKNTQEGIQEGTQAEPVLEPAIAISTARPSEAEEPSAIAMQAPETARKEAETVIETPAFAPKPPPKPPAARAVVLQPARSLAGHDRFLVSQPLRAIGPADFELGPLLDKNLDPSITPLLDALAEAISDKKLESVAFSTNGLILAKLLYETELASAPAITKVRYSEARRMPGTTYAVALRLFSELGSTVGLALLGNDADGNWLIEQLDLELDRLDEPSTESELWDPYGYSRNSLD